MAAQATVLPLRRSGDSERGLELVLNGAYLVSDGDTERFHATAAALAERCRAESMELEVTGPWPPYNFVRLDLSLEEAA